MTSLLLRLLDAYVGEPSCRSSELCMSISLPGTLMQGVPLILAGNQRIDHYAQPEFDCIAVPPFHTPDEDNYPSGVT